MVGDRPIIDVHTHTVALAPDRCDAIRGATAIRLFGL